MKTVRRVFGYATLVIALSAMVFAGGCGEKAQEEAAPVVRPVKTMKIGGVMAGRLTFPGRVQASQRVNLSFRVSGPLVEFPVNEGQEIETGQLLARIDPRDYRIALDEARAAYEKAESDYQRYQRLYEREAVPLSDLDFYLAQRDVAKARLDNAKVNLSDTYLKAPFSGRVGEKYVENYEEVTSLQNILSLHDITHIEIVIDVPEYIMASVKAQREVRLIAVFESAAGQEYPLEFLESSAQADRQTQTYRVTLTMPQPEELRILPGMTAQVKVFGLVAGVDEASSDFIVPAQAVFAGDDGTQHVWIVNEDMTVHRREVKVGRVTGEGDIRIHSGLSAGEMIATSGVTQLHEGMKVLPLEK